MQKYFHPSFLIVLVVFSSAVLFTACEDENNDGNNYNVPDTYVFTDDNGNNTVSYSGQEDRLAMVGEIKDYADQGNTGTTLDAQAIKDMLRNQNDPFSEAALNNSSKEIYNKVFPAVQSDFDAWADAIATASQSTSQASDGTAGVLSNGTKQYLFDENGFEIAQLLEKGLMGALMYYQGTSVYLEDGKMNVDNSTAEDPANGKYYTEMEHHWDEAFGYFGVPTDFPATVPSSFWGKYCNGRDGEIGSNDKIMNAFLQGRAAITNNDLDTRDAAIATIKSEWELVVAATAIHYVNGSLADISDDVLRNHQLSEAYAFIWSLQFNVDASVSNQQVNDWLNLIGGNLYQVSTTDLNTLRDELADTYGLNDVKDQL